MNKIVVLLLLMFSSFFSFSQETELKDWFFYSQKDSISHAVKIPHTWNVLDAFDDEPGYYRGKGTYTTPINISNSKKAYFLHFNGVNQHVKIWVNSKFVGEHKGGYTAFNLNISEFLNLGENTVKVEVDNTHNETIPPLDADFTFSGGIYRSVYLVEENKQHFKKENGADAIKINALLDDDYNGKLEIFGKVEENQANIEFKLKLIFKNEKNVIITTEEKNITANFNLNIDVIKPELWSPNAPKLYNLELELYQNNELLDSYQHKIGFRKFETTSKGFYLNGKPLKLIGVNRHQDWEGMGNAVPISKQIQDLIMIKDMGSNFLRLAHYPQDKAIYKAADSLGLILWSEIPVVNKVPPTVDYFEYKNASMQMQKEHIAQNYNHPSLIFIGYMNEIFLRMVFDKDDEQTKLKIIENSLELANELETLTRMEAPHHITVMALHGNQIYNNTGIASIPMVIGWNLYYGWYEGNSSDLGVFLDNEFKKYPDRPLIISEYGVGADRRLHNSNPKKFDFSEEYQFDYHPSYYKQIMERPFVVGMSAWNFADFGSEFRGDAIPHVNQKGLVNFDRTPKNIYYWYKGMLLPEMNQSLFFKELDDYISSDAKKEIIIISNQTILLTVNDEETIQRVPENGMIKQVVNLKEGVNKLKLFNFSGALQDSISIKHYPPDLNKISSLAVSFGTESSFLDSDNQIWIPLNQISNIQISGVTKTITSSSNIKKTFNDPIYQSALSNVEKITLNLPKGNYKVTLLFSNLKKDNRQIYELNKKENQSISNSVKKLKINGKIISINQIDAFNKEEVSVVVSIKKGLIIESVKNENFTICGLKIIKE